MSERTSPRILHVSQSDRAGGANRATYRLHQALCEAGADSRLWTAYKSQDDPTVIPALRSPPAKLVAQISDFANTCIPRLYRRGKEGNFSSVRLALIRAVANRNRAGPDRKHSQRARADPTAKLPLK